MNGNVNGKGNGIGMGMGMGNGIAFGTATGNGHSALVTPNWARRSQRRSRQCAPIPITHALQWLGVSACGGGIDRLFNWLRCLPAPLPSPSSQAAAWQWSDVDKAHPRQRRRLNCRTFYSRPFLWAQPHLLQGLCHCSYCRTAIIIMCRIPLPV